MRRNLDLLAQKASINLLFDGINSNDATMRQDRDNPQSDVFVHEFCKLLGKHGVPAWFIGVSRFLTAKLSLTYYDQCLKIKLDRQVGSRYFVTDHFPSGSSY